MLEAHLPLGLGPTSHTWRVTGNVSGASSCFWEAEWLHREGELKPARLIGWWERRRLRYNAVILLALAASVPLWLGVSSVVSLLVGPLDGTDIPWGLLAFVLCAVGVCANVGYTVGWVLDLSMQALPPLRHAALRERLPCLLVRSSWVGLLAIPLIYLMFWLAVGLWMGARILSA